MYRRDFFKIMAGTAALTFQATRDHWEPLLKPAAELATRVSAPSEKLIFVYSPELSWQVVESARVYLQNFLGSSKPFELRPLTNSLAQEQIRAEAFLTSASLKSTLSEDRLNIGADLFEQNASEKKQWLESSEGRQAQERLFNWDPDCIHLVACGLPTAGFFSRQVLNSLEQLQGLRYGHWDVTGEWWRNLGTQIREIRAETSLIHLLEQRVDFTGIMSHSNQAHVLRREKNKGRNFEGLHYVTASILASPTIHFLSSPKSKSLTGSSNGTKETALVKASRYLRQTESDALAELRLSVPVHQLPQSIETALHRQAEEHLKKWL